MVEGPRGVRAAALVVLAACGGAAHGPYSRDEVEQRLTTSHGPALASMLHPGLVYGGMWFEDPACQQQFIASGEIGADRIDAFARCLETLKLTRSGRHHPYSDVIELEYAPGFEVEAQFDDAGAIRWIGYAERHDLRDALPAITPEALEGLRTSGAATPALDDATAARLRAERTELGVRSSYAWLKVCLDIDGKVTGAKPREESSPVARDVFEAAVLRWQFHPFVVGGLAIPVCALVYVSDQRDEKMSHLLPQPVPPDLGSVIVGARALHRVSGETQIVPTEPERAAMANLHMHLLISAFAYCIDESGAVTGVRQTRRSGLDAWDHRVAGILQGWKYKSFVVEGKALAACSGVKFIYSQR
jgi:hypothetical protein